MMVVLESPVTTFLALSIDMISLVGLPGKRKAPVSVL